MNRFLHHAPLVRVALPLLMGASLAAVVRWAVQLYWLDSIAIVLLLILIYNRRIWKYPRNYVAFGLIYFGFLFICGYSLASLHESIHQRKLEMPQSVEVGQAKLLEPMREGPNSFYGIFELLSYWNGDTLITGNAFQFILYARKDTLLKNLQPGTELLFEGKIQSNRHTINPHQFDYAKYLERKGVGGTVYIDDKYQIIRNKANSWSFDNFFQRLQLKCVHVFDRSGIDEKELSVLNALVLGYKSDLVKETKSEFADAGVVHILAVSGLHVGIIFLIFQWLLKRVFNKKYIYIQFLLILIAIWFYAGITGFSPSVLRASTMFSFIAFGTAGGRKGNTYNMLSASIILLILINPLIIKEVGFQLSYLAVIGIVFFYDIFKPLFWSKYWLLQRGWELLVVSVSAQIATAALSIYYFGQFPNYFFISNLLVIPLATFSLYSGLLYLIVSPIPFLGEFVALITDLIASSLTWVVSLFSNLPGSVTAGIHFSIIDVVGIYLLIISLVLIGHRPNKTRILITCFSISILAASFSYKTISSAIKSELYILEAKEGAVAVLRSGTRAAFVPLYSARDFSMSQNEFYLNEFITKEGLSHAVFIRDTPANENYYYANDGFICFYETVIIYSPNLSLPKSGRTILFLSNENYARNFDFDKYDEIVFDRTLRNYQKEKVIGSLENSSVIWDMDKSGIYKKTYSDFNF